MSVSPSRHLPTLVFVSSPQGYQSAAPAHCLGVPRITAHYHLGSCSRWRAVPCAPLAGGFCIGIPLAGPICAWRTHCTTYQDLCNAPHCVMTILCICSLGLNEPRR